MRAAARSIGRLGACAAFLLPLALGAAPTVRMRPSVAGPDAWQPRVVADTARASPTAVTANAIPLAATLRVVRVPDTIPIGQDYAVGPNQTRFPSYWMRVVVVNADGSDSVLLIVADWEANAPANVSPENGLTCLLFGPQGDSACGFTIDRARNTYRITGDLPAGFVPAAVSAATYYVTGQVTLDANNNFVVPTRSDDIPGFPATLASSVSTNDVIGDLAGSTSCAPPSCHVSAVLDQGIDLAAVSITLSGGPSDYSGVKLDLAANTPGPLRIGDAYAYDLTLRNYSNSTINSINVTDAFPSGLTVDHANCQPGLMANTLDWNITTLPVGSSISCSIAVRVDAFQNSGVVSNRATATFVFADQTPSVVSAQETIGSVQHPKQQTATITGAAPSGDSGQTVISADGATIVFRSAEPALVAGDANSLGPDIFLRQADGVARLVSVTPEGTQLRGSAASPALSANARAIAFVYRPPVVPTSMENAPAAIVADDGWICASPPNGLFRPVCRVTGFDGQPLNGASEAPVLSADGQRLAYCSSASNIVAGDANGARDVFVVEQSTGAVRIASTDAAGRQGNGDSCDPAISGNGRYVTFTTLAPNLSGSALRQLMRKDLVSGELLLISRSNAGVPGDADSGRARVSHDGARIAFTSRAGNLVAGGTTAGARNLFVYSSTPIPVGAPVASKSDVDAIEGGLGNGLYAMITPSGQPPNGDVADPELSCDGRVAAFSTSATNVLGGTPLGTRDILLFAIDSRRILRAIAPQLGAEPDRPATSPALDCEANVLAFESSAGNLQADNSNDVDNVFAQENPLRIDTASTRIDASFSGNWYNPGQSGHGFLLEALPTGAFYATWYTYFNGQPVFLQGVATPDGNVLDVSMFSSSSTAFPVGPGGAVGADWGNVRFEFTGANSGRATWTPRQAGYSAGGMTLQRLTRAALKQNDRADEPIKGCYSGIWFDPTHDGYGFDVEIVDLAGGPRVVTAYWYTYQPSGAPLWMLGAGVASGDSVTMDLALSSGPGAQFPPEFATAGVGQTRWGSATLRFTGNDTLAVSWQSATSGYANGSANLQRLTYLAGRVCGD